jgi:hypothetical protein
MRVDQSVAWELAEETEVLRENLSQCQFALHKSHMETCDRARIASVGSRRLTAWAAAIPFLSCGTAGLKTKLRGLSPQANYTERPPLVGEVIANLCGQRNEFPLPLISVF